jgi:outer membrane lipoprotein SlyB
LIGALAGGKKGAAIGGAVGAGGGTGVAAATGKKEIRLAPETKLTFKLSSPVTVTVKKKPSR